MGVHTRFPNNVFPFGTHVYREPHVDLEELSSDLPILREAGFNMIKIQECWAADEPVEGEIDLSSIERVMGEARNLGLGVYLGLTMEQAPAWLWRKYPDCRLVYANGQPHNNPTQYVLPADGKPGPCWDHPGVREAAERFIGELVRRLSRFENLWCWNVWQEIGFWPQDGGILGFCYCPHTLSRFREWLHQRYGTLAALNEAWCVAYGDWAEVEPPRREANVPSFTDWRYFMDDVYLARVIEWKTRVLKENDPRQRPVFSHVGTPYIGSGAEWRWARTADYFGTSNYPNWFVNTAWDDDRTAEFESVQAGMPAAEAMQAELQIWDGIMLRNDYCRCAGGRGRTHWGAEYQGGPICTELRRGKDPCPADIRRWMLAGLASGMNGISFWNHRSEILWREGNGFGLLDARGNTTPRFAEAARIGRALNVDPQVFALGEPPQAQAAILVNEDLYHFCQAAGNRADQLLAFGVRGYYYALWRRGIAADFVESADVAHGGLAGYRAVFMPVPLALEAGLFAHLRDYVAEGGLLVSDACPGRFTRYGLCPRAQMVDGAEEVFGARHRDVRQVHEPDGAHRWYAGEFGAGDALPPVQLEGRGRFEGARVAAAFYLQTLEPDASEVVFEANDAPAAVVNRFGKGHAMLMGTFASFGALAHRAPAYRGLIDGIARMAGLEEERWGGIIRRKRVLDDREAWFFVNPAPSAAAIEVALDGYTFERDLLDEKTAGQHGQLRLTVPPMNLSCVLVRRNA